MTETIERPSVQYPLTPVQDYLFREIISTAKEVRWIHQDKVISLDTTLRGDLDLDSLHMAEILADLEERLHLEEDLIRFPINVSRTSTIRDFITAIEECGKEYSKTDDWKRAADVWNAGLIQKYCH